MERMPFNIIYRLGRALQTNREEWGAGYFINEGVVRLLSEYTFTFTFFESCWWDKKVRAPALTYLLAADYCTLHQLLGMQNLNQLTAFCGPNRISPAIYIRI